MHSANGPGVQRKVVVRTKSGSCTENESSPANIVYRRGFIRHVHLFHAAKLLSYRPSCCRCAVISALSKKRTARARLTRGHKAGPAPSARQPHNVASRDRRGTFGNDLGARIFFHHLIVFYGCSHCSLCQAATNRSLRTGFGKKM